MKYKIIVIFLFLLKQICFGKNVYPYGETQDPFYNLQKAEDMLRVINESVDLLLAQLNITSVIVQFGLIIARTNLEYLIKNMDEKLQKKKFASKLKDTSRKMLLAHDELHLDYHTNEIKDAMKLIVYYENIFVESVNPLKLGYIKNRRQKYVHIIYHPILYNTKSFVLDPCMYWLLSYGSPMAQSNAVCIVDRMCYDHKALERYGVLLDLGILYVFMSKVYECSVIGVEADLRKLCENAYTEMNLIERFDFTTNMTEVFALHMSLCGTVGYGEFVKPRWMNRLMSWRSSLGYFRNPTSNTDTVSFTAQVMACLSLYVRALISK